jgi:hypothetical protein
MKHPVRSEFDTAVTEAGVTVTFKHGQHLQFSLIGRYRHCALASLETGTSSSDEVQYMARLENSRSVLVRLRGLEGL